MMCECGIHPIPSDGFWLCPDCGECVPGEFVGGTEFRPSFSGYSVNWRQHIQKIREKIVYTEKVLFYDRNQVEDRQIRRRVILRRYYGSYEVAIKVIDSFCKYARRVPRFNQSTLIRAFEEYCDGIGYYLPKLLPGVRHIRPWKESDYVLWTRRIVSLGFSFNRSKYLRVLNGLKSTAVKPLYVCISAFINSQSGIVTPHFLLHRLTGRVGSTPMYDRIRAGRKFL